MKHCKTCNASVEDAQNFCSFCGGTNLEGVEVVNFPDSNDSNKQGNPNNNNNYNNYNQPNNGLPPVYRPIDSNSFGWVALGFFLPMVGLILYIIWKDMKPLAAKKSLTGFIASIIFYVVAVVFYFICFMIIGLSSGS